MTSPTDQLCAEFWQKLLDFSPEFGTYIGFDQSPDKLDSLALSKYEDKAVFCQMMLDKIERVEGQELISPQDELNLRILKHYSTICLEGLRHRVYLMAFCGFLGPHISLNYLLKNRLKFETLDDYQNYMSRLRQFPRQMDEVKTLLDTGIKENIKGYKMNIQAGLGHIKSFLTEDVEDSRFFVPFKSLPNDFNEDKRNGLISEGTDLVQNCIVRPLREFSDYLQNVYFPKSRDTMSIIHQPNGVERLKVYVEFFCDTDKSPQELLDMGQSEVLRLQQEIKQVLKDVEFSGTMQEFHASLHAQPDQFYQSEAELHEAIHDLIENKIKPTLPRLFHTMPTLPLRIQSQKMPAVVYNAPPRGEHTSALLTVPNDLKLTPKYFLISLLLHESIPGHHYQACHTVNEDDLPNFRRYKDDQRFLEAPGTFPLNSAYTEGWALYCEELGEELGLYNNPYDKFGYLEQRIKRAVRLVVNTAIHAFEWSHEKALDYMLSNAIFHKTGAEFEIFRYTLIPIEACSYTFGYLKFKELRRKAEKELGAAFDIRDFHEACLKCGQVPLQILEDIIIDYIQQHQK